jgi:hypothetical protein
MINKIECVQCTQCNKLLPTTTSEYIIISGLKVVHRVRAKKWQEDSLWNKTLTEYSGDMEKLFCSSRCVYEYFITMIGEKED